MLFRIDLNLHVAPANQVVCHINRSAVCVWSAPHKVGCCLAFDWAIIHITDLHMRGRQEAFGRNINHIIESWFSIHKFHRDRKNQIERPSHSYPSDLPFELNATSRSNYPDRREGRLLSIRSRAILGGKPKYHERQIRGPA